jgi:hypothetical protein
VTPLATHGRSGMPMALSKPERLGRQLGEGYV